MKFSELKQYLVEVDNDGEQVIYDFVNGYVIDVFTDRDIYSLVVGGIVLYPGGVDPDYPNDEIVFFWEERTYNKDDDGSTSFSGPVADDVEVNVRLYKRI
jgi:hypothetical protein